MIIIPLGSWLYLLAPLCFFLKTSFLCFRRILVQNLMYFPENLYTKKKAGEQIKSISIISFVKPCTVYTHTKAPVTLTHHTKIHINSTCSCNSINLNSNLKCIINIKKKNLGLRFFLLLFFTSHRKDAEATHHHKNSGNLMYA